jgi:alpha-1,3-mannosyltransferase
MTPSDPPSPLVQLCLQVWHFVTDVATGRHALSKLIAPALWLADAALCVLIIVNVPYTEIDWVAYMQQVSQFVSGERDYTKMEGDTGPLVYPGAHVYTYTGLYYLTDEGKDIRLAQQLFAVLYMATLTLVMLCYKKAKVPPYVFPLLILSKRLHSVFVLRCFNDCFAALFLWLAIYCFQRRHWTLGSLAYSWGLGIKMSLLLVLPAVAVVLFLGRGFSGSLRLAWIMAQIQLLVAVPFLAKNPAGYLGRAFELSRQFKFEWTVNWRMVGEEVFLSKGFSLVLLGLHVAALSLFLTRRWLRPADRPLSAMVPALLRLQSPFTQLEELRISHYVTPAYVMTTILTANVVGLLFARSLHYQFYAYLAWSTPYLLWRALGHPLPVYVLWLMQEWAWNVFPSTPGSSSVVVNVLAATVAAVYMGTAREDELVVEEKQEKKKEVAAKKKD